jgi:S-adenosylmethionine synthetase
LDAEKHVKLHAMIRPGSADLVELYLRQQKIGVALANDTSCGVGYAPLDELEQFVCAVEKHLNSATIKAVHPEIGEDIKVMGVRQGDTIKLTVACAFVDRYISSMEDYAAKKSQVAFLISQHTQQLSNKPVNIEVNTADGNEHDSIYLTVTGTSAEAGDDGEVGRGNRVNGLITPYRPMNMEAAAGKNPVTHVGKLYNIVAQYIAADIVQELTDVQEAQCYLVSRIGHPIHEPQVVDLKVQLQEGVVVHEVQPRIRDIAHEHLSNIGSIQDQLLNGAIKVY